MEYESTDRTIKLDDDSSWFWIGLRVGLGFSLGSAVVASITAVLWAAWIENGVRVELRDLNRGMPKIIQPSFQPSYSTPVAPSSPINEHGSRHVAARPAGECLAESNNVYDERFERCTHGFIEQY